MPNLSTREKFLEDLKKSGFKNIRYYNKFEAIKKTRDRIYRLALLGYIFSLLTYKLRMIPKCLHDNTVMGINQKKLCSDKNNIATYGVFVAEK